MGAIISFFRIIITFIVDILLLLLVWTPWSPNYNSRDAGFKAEFVAIMFIIIFFGSIMLFIWLSGGLERAILDTKHGQKQLEQVSNESP